MNSKRLSLIMKFHYSNHKNFRKYPIKKFIIVGGRKNMEEGCLKVTTPGKIGPYIIKEVIGYGKTCVVFRGVSKSTNENVAIKVLPKRQFFNPWEASKFQSEVSTLFRCQHKNVLSLICLIHDTLNFYMVTELYEGDMQMYIANNHRLSVDEARVFCREIADALQFIHSKGVAHRDIKLDNLLYDKAKRIIISDFGYSIICDDSLVKNFCGTMVYSPPEIVRKEPYNPFMSDVWSAGIVFYALLTSKFPWPTKDQNIMIQKIQERNITFPDYVPDQARDLINKMTEIEPGKRLTFNQIVNHPWLRDIAPPSYDISIIKHKPDFENISEVFRSAMNQMVIVSKFPKKKSKGKKSLPYGNSNMRKGMMEKDVISMLRKSNRIGRKHTIHHYNKNKIFTIPNPNKI